MYEEIENQDSDVRVQDIVTVKEASEILGITVEGVWYHIKRGRIRLVRIGKVNFVIREDLTKLKRKRI